MAAAPRKQLEGCSVGQHPSREPSALNAESPGNPAKHPSMLDAEALPPHSPSQPGCLPATHHTCGEELCPKATGAHPQQHLSKQGQLLPTGCTGTQGQRMEATFLHRKKQHPQEGQRLELECLNCDRNRPIFWIRLDKSGNLHFIAYSTHSYPSTLKEGEKTSPNFEALWKGNSYRLVVNNFRAQDQGTYFCVNYINQVLHFSSGQPAFFPGTTAALPATTQSSQFTTKDIFWHSLDPGRSKENMPNFYCKSVMWVNLVCACLLLLTAITITITHCQRPSSP
eukprot:XP_001235029.3 T-cell surface glycoprotein CD8 alpha chain-like isoform X2 [Gallus gallus]